MESAESGQPNVFASKKVRFELPRGEASTNEGKCITSLNLLSKLLKAKVVQVKQIHLHPFAEVKISLCIMAELYSTKN